MLQRPPTPIPRAPSASLRTKRARARATPERKYRDLQPYRTPRRRDFALSRRRRAFRTWGKYATRCLTSILKGLHERRLRRQETAREGDATEPETKLRAPNREQLKKVSSRSSFRRNAKKTRNGHSRPLCWFESKGRSYIPESFREFPLHRRVKKDPTGHQSKPNVSSPQQAKALTRSASPGHGGAHTSATGAGVRVALPRRSRSQPHFQRGAASSVEHTTVSQPIPSPISQNLPPLYSNQTTPSPISQNLPLLSSNQPIPSPISQILPPSSSNQPIPSPISQNLPPSSSNQTTPSPISQNLLPSSSIQTTSSPISQNLPPSSSNQPTPSPISQNLPPSSSNQPTPSPISQNLPPSSSNQTTQSPISQNLPPSSSNQPTPSPISQNLPPSSSNQRTPSPLSQNLPPSSSNPHRTSGSRRQPPSDAELAEALIGALQLEWNNFNAEVVRRAALQAMLSERRRNAPPGPEAQKRPGSPPVRTPKPNYSLMRDEPPAKRPNPGGAGSSRDTGGGWLMAAPGVPGVLQMHRLPTAGDAGAGASSAAGRRASGRRATAAWRACPCNSRPHRPPLPPLQMIRLPAPQPPPGHVQSTEAAAEVSSTNEDLSETMETDNTGAAEGDNEQPARRRRRRRKRGKKTAQNGDQEQQQ